MGFTRMDELQAILRRMEEVIAGTLGMPPNRLTRDQAREAMRPVRLAIARLNYNAGRPRLILLKGGKGDGRVG